MIYPPSPHAIPGHELPLRDPMLAHCQRGLHTGILAHRLPAKKIGDSHLFFLDLPRDWWYDSRMVRIARVVIAGVAHHVTQRGNNAQDVFFVDDDRRVYLDLLRHQCEKCGLEVLGYCLMTNHVHLVAKPFKEDSLAKAVGRTHFLYTQYINRLQGRRGHLSVAEPILLVRS